METSTSEVFKKLFLPIDKLNEALRNIATLAILASKCDFENYDINLLQDFWSLQLAYINDARIHCDYLEDLVKKNQN